jgi:3-mercaptopyruvate sulfurtransferase SseA
MTRTTRSGDAHRSGAEGLTTLADTEAKFRAHVTRDKRVICYCGGGISATIDLFLLHSSATTI